MMREPLTRCFLLNVLLIACLAFPVVVGAQSSESKAEPIKVGASDWPWWRGPATTGAASADQDLPLQWSESKNIVWKVDIPGRGHGSPIVVGDHVYLPTADRKANVQLVMCFDRSTGKLVWKTQVHRGGIMKKNRKASQASSTMACDGKRLFVSFLNAGAVYTTALDRNGKKLWQTKISDYVIHQGYGASPALYKSLVIIAADNKGGGAIAALDRANGKIVWRVDRPAKPNYVSPVIIRAAGREQLIFMGCDLVSSFEPMTGKKLWEVEGATTECVSTTVTNGDLIYTSGGYPKNHVSAVRADGSGKVVWKNTTRVYVPSLLIKDGYLYITADQGDIVCCKADTGKEMWKEKMRGSPFSSSPVLVGDHILGTNERGTTFVFKADPQKFELVAKNQLGNEAMATPTVCGGRIYMRVAHNKGATRQEVLYCIGKGAE